MDTDIYRAARLAYRLGRQDHQRILELRLRKHFDSDVQAKQIRDLAAGMTDEMVDFDAIVRAAQEGSTPVNSADEACAEPGLVNGDGSRSEQALRERHTETCPRISNPGSECLVCEVFQRLAGERARFDRYRLGIKAAIGDRDMRDDNPGMPLRSDTNEIRKTKAALLAEAVTIAEYETVLKDFGYDFEGEVDCIDWLRSALGRGVGVVEAVAKSCRDIRRQCNLDRVPEVEEILREIEAQVEVG